MATTIALAIFGVAMIYSATLGTEGNTGLDSRVIRQIAYLIVGIGLLVTLATTDYHILSNLSWLLYGGCVGLLIAVFVIGRVTHGSQRWIPLGFFDLQPSEPAKLALVIVLAKFFADRPESIGKLRIVAVSAALTAVPAVLTLLQPDLGTAMVFVAIWLGMLVIAGLRWIHALLLAVLAGGAAPFAWHFMPTYQKGRLLIFMDPTADPLGDGYNVIQALISVGSGGLTGRGFTFGTQSQLHFLRVQYADFIFSVVAEELGFVGALVLLTLFLVLLLRAVRAASIAWDGFGRLLCVGIVAMLAVQTFVNIGMNIGLLPVTGVPLPLISYGGSTAFTIFAAVGVLEGVAMRHKRFEF